MNPFDPGYYRSDELRAFGMKVGDNVMIAKNCTIIGLQNVSIGDNVRIDGFTTIAAASGHLTVGSYVHVGGYCFLACAGGVTLDDFSGLSQGCKVYSVSDDYSGHALTNPTVPRHYLNVKSAPVRLGRHVVIGSGTVILPGASVGDGSSVGAQSIVTKPLGEWGVYFGSPVRRLKDRSKELLADEWEMVGSGQLAAQ